MGTFRDLEAKGTATFRQREKGNKRSVAQEVTGFMANVNRGLGVGDEMAAGAQTAVNVLTGRTKLRDVPQDFQRSMAGQREVEDDFAARRPLTAAGARGTGMAATAALPAGTTVTSGNALMAGARAGTAAAASGYAYGLADRGNLQERVQNANVSAAIAAPVGFAGGAAVNALTGRARSRPERAMRQMGDRTGAEANALTRKAEELRAAGVEPTLADVAGERGRRVIRAVGVKSEDAGEALTLRAREVSSTAKPAIMERTRDLGRTRPNLTADDVKAGLESARQEGVETIYRPAYQTRVQITDETIQALNDEPGRAALRRARLAAVARQDQAQIAEIDALIKMNPPPAEISAGTLDRVRIAMRGRADKLAQSPDTRDIAGGLRPRVDMIDSTLDQVPELAPARADYRAKSQAIGVLGKDRRDVFSTAPADYAKWLDTLPPEAVEANRTAIRQEIIDTLGGQRSSTMGSVDELVTSPYARENLAKALGPQEAQRYLANLDARLQQVRNARMVEPNAGSRTAVLQNDLQGVMQAADLGKSVARGDAFGALEKAATWLMGRGVSEQDARVIAEMAVDPRRLNEAIAYLETRGAARQEAAQIVRQLHLTQAAGIGAGAPTN